MPQLHYTRGYAYCLLQLIYIGWLSCVCMLMEKPKHAHPTRKKVDLMCMPLFALIILVYAMLHIHDMNSNIDMMNRNR
jgi:hypothetical protein